MPIQVAGQVNGQKEYQELLMAGQDPYPAVLDEIIPELGADSTQKGTP